MTTYREPQQSHQRAGAKPDGVPRPPAQVAGCCDRNQAALGNSAVKAIALKSARVQTKLKVSSAGDSFEEEADRMAELVVARKAQTSATGGRCPSCGDTASCPKCRAHSRALQRKPASPARSEPPGQTEAALDGIRGAGHPLPAAVRVAMESQFGRDFDAVRVHDDERAHALARSLGARAFTTGNDVVFAAGEYQPESPQGQRLLAHELTHVSQQGGADEIRRAPDPAAGLAPGNPGPNFYVFQGMMMSADPLAMHRELRLYVRHFGIKGLDLWHGVLTGARTTHDIPFSAHARAFGGLRVRGPMDMQRDAENDAWRNQLAPAAVPLALALYPVVRQEALDLLARFEKVMGTTLEIVLNESELRLNAEKIRYGVKDNSSFWSGVKFTAQNNGDLQALAGAAKDLSLKQAAIAKLEKQKQMEMAAAMFGDADEAQSKVKQIDAQIEPLKAEYQQAKTSASLRHPALGAALDESSFGGMSEADRLQTLAGGATSGGAYIDMARGGLIPASAASMLGLVFQARQDAINTVRSMGRSTGRLWSIAPIVSLTQGLMAGEPTGMLSGVVKEKLDQIAFDEAIFKSFMMVATLALAIPTGGGSLGVMAGTAALSLSAFQAVQSIRDYQFQYALANSDLDKKAYALASEEPSAFWVALDVVAVFLDAHQALSAFRAVKAEARAAALAIDGAEALARETKLVELADKISGVSKSKLGARLRESLAKMRGQSRAERALGAGIHEAQAVERAAAAIEKESKHAETIANIGGHQLKVTPSGHIVLCTECKWLRGFYASELATNSKFLERLEELEKKVLAGPLDDAAKSELKMLTIEMEQARKIRVTPGAASSMPKELQDAAALAPKAASKDAAIAAGESEKYIDTTTKGRGVKGDKLTGDHIPSRAALVEAKQNAIWDAEANRLGRELSPAEKDALALTDAEKAQINREGQALVKGESFHVEESRTWGPRNTPEQIRLDGSDLSRATYSDFLTDLKAIESAGELTRARVAEYIQHYQQLVSRGVIAYSDDINKLLLDYLKKAKP